MPARLEIVGILAVSVAMSACSSPPTEPSQPLYCTPLVGPGSTLLREGDLFRFRFRVPAGANADVMLVFAGSAVAFSSSSTRTSAGFRLYDGANRLGVYGAGAENVAYFKSPDSLFGLRGSPYEHEPQGLAATVADFHSIVDGTIDGRVELFVSLGSLSILDLDKSTVLLLNPDAQGGTGNPVVSDREFCR
jgi:hypothetical protein